MSETQPPAQKPKKICVCRGKTCGPLGGPRLMERLEQHYGLAAGQANDQVDLRYRACRGFCEEGPTVDVDDKTVIRAKPDTIVDDIEQGRAIDMRGREVDVDIDELLSDLL